MVYSKKKKFFCQIEVNVLVSVQKSNYDWGTRPCLGHALISEYSIFQRQTVRVYNCIAHMLALTEKSTCSFTNHGQLFNNSTNEVLGVTSIHGVVDVSETFETIGVTITYKVSY